MLSAKTKNNGIMNNKTTHKDHQLVTRFDDIYNLPACRAYYHEMYDAQYRNAHFAVDAFRATLAELIRVRNLGTPSVMDFASGYGIGALLLRHDITLDQLLGRYQDANINAMTHEEVNAADKKWFSENQGEFSYCNTFGIDVAGRALEYGVATGIYDQAYAIDLQDTVPEEDLTEQIRNCDLIIEVGSVIHMLPDALERILSLAGETLPWIISSPIRGNESKASMEIMENAGLVVEKYPVPPFQHRIFIDKAEQNRAIELVEERGFDTAGYESEGCFHAQLYLARPKNEVMPVADWAGGF